MIVPRIVPAGWCTSVPDTSRKPPPKRPETAPKPASRVRGCIYKRYTRSIVPTLPHLSSFPESLPLSALKERILYHLSGFDLKWYELYLFSPLPLPHCNVQRSWTSNALAPQNTVQTPILRLNLWLCA